MFYEDRHATDRLHAIVHKFTHDREDHKDLMQDALFFLWVAEARNPGQTESWT